MCNTCCLSLFIVDIDYVYDIYGWCLHSNANQWCFYHKCMLTEVALNVKTYISVMDHLKNIRYLRTIHFVMVEKATDSYIQGNECTNERLPSINVSVYWVYISLF